MGQHLTSLKWDVRFLSSSSEISIPDSDSCDDCSDSSMDLRKRGRLLTNNSEKSAAFAKKTLLPVKTIGSNVKFAGNGSMNRAE